MSKKAQAKRFISHLSRIASTNYNSLFTKQQLRDTVKELGLQVVNGWSKGHGALCY